MAKDDKLKMPTKSNIRKTLPNKGKPIYQGRSPEENISKTLPEGSIKRTGAKYPMQIKPKSNWQDINPRFGSKTTSNSNMMISNRKTLSETSGYADQIVKAEKTFGTSIRHKQPLPVNTVGSISKLQKAKEILRTVRATKGYNIASKVMRSPIVKYGGEALAVAGAITAGVEVVKSGMAFGDELGNVISKHHPVVARNVGDRKPSMGKSYTESQDSQSVTGNTPKQKMYPMTVVQPSQQSRNPFKTLGNTVNTVGAQSSKQSKGGATPSSLRETGMVKPKSLRAVGEITKVSRKPKGLKDEYNSSDYKPKVYRTGNDLSFLQIKPIVPRPRPIPRKEQTWLK